MNLSYSTAQKMKFSIKDLFSKCDLIGSFPRIWSHLLKKSLMENFIFCAVFQFFHILVIILIKEQFTLWITKFHIQWQYFPTLNLVYLYLLHVFMRTIFCLSLNFLQKVLQIRLVFSSYFFTFISLFSLIVYLVRFNTNNKHHFVTNTGVQLVYNNKQTK